MQRDNLMKRVSSLLALGLICVLISISRPAWAQTCTNNARAQACEFDTQPIDLDWENLEQGDISFRVISRKCQFLLTCLFQIWESATYTVEINGPSAGNNFVLSGPSGSLPLNLSYSSGNITNMSLLPNTQVGPINDGSNSYHYAYLTVSLPGPGTATSLLAGIYSNSFQLTLRQQGDCGFFSCGSDTVSFTIEIHVLANIRISGLDDMVINAPTEMMKDEDFCVFTQGGANFGIKAESAAGNGSFQLEGQNTGDRITYQAEADTYPSSAPILLNEGIPTSAIWSGNIQQDCGGGSNMRIIISLPFGALESAIENQYRDTLTLTVELE